ncbi:nucleotidyltransferase domain-containing protein [Ktedonobacter racemifer]|nr:nucleotidyltransferase domain-containing protein [Ktedonobacter racemifer]
MIINNETSTEKIESLYFPLIDEALSIYQEIFQDALIEIRLLGSVPRGEAHPGSSDIDFMALIREKSREASLSLLQESSRRLQSTYLFVSQVDLDCFDVASLSPFQRFVLSSDSLSIYGKDEFTKKVQMIKREHLASLVTPNITALVQEYTDAIHLLESKEALRQMSRVIGKDLLRCLRYILIVEQGIYEKTIENIHKQLLHTLPEYKERICDLFTLYVQPTANKQALLHCLHCSRQELIPLLQRYGF